MALAAAGIGGGGGLAMGGGMGGGNVALGLAPDLVTAGALPPSCN